MSKNLLICLLLLFCLNAKSQSPLTGNPAELPFSLELEDVTQDELPGLHSFAFAHWGQWWVVIGGRIGGLHGFFPFTAFPENEANANIFLIDPETGEYHTFFVDNLNVPFKDPLKSTNPQYTQDGAVLYITGGYGKQQSTGDFITFPVLTAVSLPELVNSILAETNPSNAFQQIELASMQVCGGEMEKLGDYFYLIGGHNIAGTYTQTPSPAYTQTYTSEIRKFKINRTNTSLAISNYTAYHDDNNLHRRDFSLGPVIQTNGAEALCLYGGVFRPDADLPYYNPIYIEENDIFNLDVSYQQVFSQYTCPILPMYDSINADMYSIFFAGLSAHFWDSDAQQIKYDEKVPFIKDISTLRHFSSGQSLEYLMPQKFDELLGANMIFVPNEQLSHYTNEVIRLNKLEGKTLAGYLFGGIKASIPNLTPSSASNRMFKVFITPKTSTQTSLVSNSEQTRLIPNPSATNKEVKIESTRHIEYIRVCSLNGQLVKEYDGITNLDQINLQLSALPQGMYLVYTRSDADEQVLKLIRL
jgi:hypothetical protein